MACRSYEVVTPPEDCLGPEIKTAGATRAYMEASLALIQRAEELHQEVGFSGKFAFAGLPKALLLALKALDRKNVRRALERQRAWNWKQADDHAMDSVRDEIQQQYARAHGKTTKHQETE